MNKLLLAALLLLAGTASAADEYYMLTTDYAVSAGRRGDELFAELVTPTHNVDGPQSIAVQIYGSCSERVFTTRGVAMFSGAWRAGYIVSRIEADNVIRKVRPGSVIDKLFKKECAAK